VGLTAEKATWTQWLCGVDEAEQIDRLVTVCVLLRELAADLQIANYWSTVTF